MECEAMPAAGEIAAIATKIVEALKRVPRSELLDEISVPLQQAHGYTMVQTKRFKYNIADLHDVTTGFRAAALEVGAVLSRHYDLRPLLLSEGSVRGSDAETAGWRFLERLIDASLVGRSTLPRNGSHILRVLSERFCQDLIDQKVSVDWIYPIGGLRLTRKALRLSRGAMIRPLALEDWITLVRNETPFYPRAATLALSTHSALTIEGIAAPPMVLSMIFPNSEVLDCVQVSVVLASLAPLPILGCYMRCRTPTVLFPSNASYMQWVRPERYHHTFDVSEALAFRLRRIFRAVADCPRDIIESIPMQRLFFAASRAQVEDRLIDVWIGLESLLLGREDRAELTYKMALRAVTLAKAQEGVEFVSRFKKAYGDRSRLVHGGGGPLSREAGERLGWVYKLLLQFLLASVRRHELPNVAMLDRQMLKRKK
jgi:hypothetical protein